MAIWRLITSDPNPPSAPREALSDCVVRITGDYFWDKNIPHGVPEYFDDYSHRRNIELTAENPEELWNETRLAPRYSNLPALNLRIHI